MADEKKLTLAEATGKIESLETELAEATGKIEDLEDRAVAVEDLPLMARVVEAARDSAGVGDLELAALNGYLARWRA